MKAGIFVVLWTALVASCVSIRADDNADQAVARTATALEQKFYDLDQTDARKPPPAESSTNAVSATAAAPRTAPAEDVPASTAPADAAFAAEIPAASPSAQAAALAALEQKMRGLNPQAQPVTEIPTAEAPMAKSPGIAPSVVAPLSAAPGVVAPAPEVSTTPAVAASVAVVPVNTPRPVTLPTQTSSAAAPAMLKTSLMLHAATLPSSSARPVRPANKLVTTTGAIYKNVEVERVMADGIIISYTPANGGWAMTTVYFQDLPVEIRQQYEK